MWPRKRNGTDVRKHLSACRNDLAALQKDARELANDISGVTRDGATRAARSASNALDLVSSRLDGVAQIDSGSVRRFARSQPLVAIAFLASAGAVLGHLLSRR
jgi:ElaB/YqjD/DUF883 family membrane-anchored ribosome-binding protein